MSFDNIDAKSNEDLPVLIHPAPIVPKSNDDLPMLPSSSMQNLQHMNEKEFSDQTSKENSLPIKDSPFSSDLFWDSGIIPSFSYSYDLSSMPSYRSASPSLIPETSVPSRSPSFSPVATPSPTYFPSIQPSFNPTSKSSLAPIPSQFQTQSSSQSPTPISTALPLFNISETVDHILSELFESTKQNSSVSAGASMPDHFDSEGISISSAPTIPPSKSNSEHPSQAFDSIEQASDPQDSVAPQVNEFNIPPKDNSGAWIYNSNSSVFFIVLGTWSFFLLNEFM